MILFIDSAAHGLILLLHDSSDAQVARMILCNGKNFFHGKKGIAVRYAANWSINFLLIFFKTFTGLYYYERIDFWRFKRNYCPIRRIWFSWWPMVHRDGSFLYAFLKSDFAAERSPAGELPGLNPALFCVMNWTAMNLEILGFSWRRNPIYWKMNRSTI